jgi:hypothetical protein
MEDTLKTRLTELGLTDEQVTKLVDEGVTTDADMALLTSGEIKETTGCGLILAKKVAQAFVLPVLTVPVSTSGETDPSAEIPEGTQPSTDQVNNYAAQLGLSDPSGLMNLMFMSSFATGAGLDMDLSGMVPIPQIVAGYNPKRRDMPYVIMGQIEARLRTPIIVINADGSVNGPETVKYINSLEEGFDPADDNVWYDETGQPYEVIGVGVDAQSIYDADPVQPSRALQKNGMGTGRVNWNNVPMDVRQVVFYAATQTGELNPKDDARLSWLRDHIRPATTRMTLRSEFPKAISLFNEHARMGDLPTLKIQLTRGARRPEVMPRRRRKEPRNLSEYPREPAFVRGATDEDNYNDGFGMETT